MHRHNFSCNLKGSLLTEGVIDKKVVKSRKLLMNNLKKKYMNFNILLKQKNIFSDRNRDRSPTNIKTQVESTKETDMPDLAKNPHMHNYFLENCPRMHF